MRLAGEQKLLKLSNIFQEHQDWLKQAFEDARAHLVAQKDPAGAKTQRSKCASDKVGPPLLSLECRRTEASRTYQAYTKVPG